MDYFDRHVLETLIYLPMLAALVLVFVPRERKQATESWLIDTIMRRRPCLSICSRQVG